MMMMMMMMMMMTEQIFQLCHLLTQTSGPGEVVVVVVAIATGCKTSVATISAGETSNKKTLDQRSCC